MFKKITLGKEDFDFSGVDQFLKIMNILEEDREPSSKEWDSLFATPGYNVLVRIEFKKEFFMEKYRLAFKPSEAGKLKKALNAEKDKPFHRQFLRHYIKTKEKEREIKEQKEKLKVRASSIIKEAVDKAFNFLPQKEVAEYPPVSFVIFSYDARGYSPIVVDMLYGIELGDMLSNLLGHEFHHYYRNKILPFDYKDIVASDGYLIWILNQIHCEGIADQIDKRELLSSTSYRFFAKKWENAVEKVPEIIGKMDELLCEIAEHSENKKKISVELKKLIPMSGHPVGFYMTNVILKQIGKEELVKEVGNPFFFFHLYNRAAKMKGGEIPIFSNKALSVISELERNDIKK